MNCLELGLGLGCNIIQSPVSPDDFFVFIEDDYLLFEDMRTIINP